MTSAFPSCPDHGDWKTLYRAAILETNKNVIPQKVSEAELVVLARGRELFYGGEPARNRNRSKMRSTPCVHSGALWNTP
jgi:hypothetical protein